MSKINTKYLVAMAVALLHGEAVHSQAVLHGFDSTTRILDQYIVVFKPGVVDRARTQGPPGAARDFARREDVDAVARSLASSHRGDVQRAWNAALEGFLVRMSEADAKALARDPRVALVSADEPIELTTPQQNAWWGLDRIDQADRPGNGVYNYYGNASGVHAYVIDTGIRATHNEFEGRVSSGYDGIGDGQGTNDCNGHGTHVAGIVGGKTWGVAKKVTLHPVRVYGCSGSSSLGALISGVDWVTANRIRPAVAVITSQHWTANGAPNPPAMRTAYLNAIAAGVIMVVSAGNDPQDSCANTIAREPEVITVAASKSDDTRSSFSATGSCIDLYAPGQDIRSAWVEFSSNSKTRDLDGTSQAAPHAAGVAALYLQAHPLEVQSQVSAALVGSAVSRMHGQLFDSTSLLLQSLVPGNTPATCNPCVFGPLGLEAIMPVIDILLLE